MARDHTVEIVEAMSKMVQDVAQAVSEGIGKGIAEAMGYNRALEVVEPKDENVEEESFFPDVERGDPSSWINPDIG